MVLGKLGRYFVVRVCTRRISRCGGKHGRRQSLEPFQVSGSAGSAQRSCGSGECEAEEGGLSFAAAPASGGGHSGDSKKSLRASGDSAESPRLRRQRMITAAEELAPTTGVAPACRALGVSRASLYRRRWGPRPRRNSCRRASPRALSPEERNAVLGVLHEPRFVDRSPAAIYATLLEEGQYFGSIRTMYRALESHGEVQERREQRRHPRREPPRLVATGPNQVWTWDITRLAGPTKWSSFALYVMLDLFSRYVVAWMVALRETAKLAKRLIREACAKQQVNPGQLTLHQDRGAPMTSKTFSQLLVDLDVLASYSRPRVSNDNPYSESGFKTLKYLPEYPGRFGHRTSLNHGLESINLTEGDFHLRQLATDKKRCLSNTKFMAHR